MTDSSNALWVILNAGFVCGVLDGIAAVLSTLYFHQSPARMFQGIASGLLGPASFKGGSPTAVLGVALHFVIAFGAATVFYFASRQFPFLIDRALLSGILYGLVVHLVMQFVVLPLSRIGYRPPVAASFLRGLAIHMIVVGPSIALTTAAVVRRY